MQAKVTFNGKMPLVGVNDKGHETCFDAAMDFSGPAKYASPMDTVLEALGSCSMMDIISILRKMRKEVTLLEAHLDAERSDAHPKVFTSVQVNYRLKSPDCTLAEFEKAAGLSMEKYCSVAAMLKASGCRITWSAELT